VHAAEVARIVESSCRRQIIRNDPNHTIKRELLAESYTAVPWRLIMLYNFDLARRIYLKKAG